MTNTPGTPAQQAADLTFAQARERIVRYTDQDAADDQEIWDAYADLEKSETAAQRKLEAADRRADRDRGI